MSDRTFRPQTSSSRQPSPTYDRDDDSADHAEPVYDARQILAKRKTVAKAEGAPKHAPALSSSTQAERDHEHHEVNKHAAEALNADMVRAAKRIHDAIAAIKGFKDGKTAHRGPADQATRIQESFDSVVKGGGDITAIIAKADRITVPDPLLLNRGLGALEGAKFQLNNSLGDTRTFVEKLEQKVTLDMGPLVAALDKLHGRLGFDPNDARIQRDITPDKQSAAALTKTMATEHLATAESAVRFVRMGLKAEPLATLEQMLLTADTHSHEVVKLLGELNKHRETVQPFMTRLLYEVDRFKDEAPASAAKDKLIVTTGHLRKWIK